MRPRRPAVHSRALALALSVGGAVGLTGLLAATDHTPAGATGSGPGPSPQTRVPGAFGDTSRRAEPFADGPSRRTTRIRPHTFSHAS